MRALPEGRGATPLSRRVIGRALAGWAAAAALAGCGFAGIGGDRLTFEVHNESNVPVTLEVVDAGGANPAQGRSIGAPIVVAPGADDPVTIVAPTSDWAVRVVGVEGYFDGRDLRDWVRQLESGDLAGFRLVIDDGGRVTAETTAP